MIKHSNPDACKVGKNCKASNHCGLSKEAANIAGLILTKLAA